MSVVTSEVRNEREILISLLIIIPIATLSADSVSHISPASLPLLSSVAGDLTGASRPLGSDLRYSAITALFLGFVVPHTTWMNQ